MSKRCLRQKILNKMVGSGILLCVQHLLLCGDFGFLVEKILERSLVIFYLFISIIIIFIFFP